MKALEEQKGFVAERFSKNMPRTRAAYQGPSSHQLPRWRPWTWDAVEDVQQGEKASRTVSGEGKPPSAFQTEPPAAAGGRGGLGDVGTGVPRVLPCVGTGVPHVLPWERGDLRTGNTPGRAAEGQVAGPHGCSRLCRGKIPRPSLGPITAEKSWPPVGPAAGVDMVTSGLDRD